MTKASIAWRANPEKMCRMVFRASDCLLDYAEYQDGLGTNSRFFVPFFTDDYATKFTKCRADIFRIFNGGGTTVEVAKLINDTFGFFDWQSLSSSKHALASRKITNKKRLDASAFGEIRLGHVVKLTRDISLYDYSLHTRTAEILGPSDESVTVGQSLQHKQSKSTYREHAVPLAYLLQTCFTKIKEGASDQQLIDMMADHVKIVLIALLSR